MSLRSTYMSHFFSVCVCFVSTSPGKVSTAWALTPSVRALYSKRVGLRGTILASLFVSEYRVTYGAVRYLTWVPKPTILVLLLTRDYTQEKKTVRDKLLY